LRRLLLHRRRAGGALERHRVLRQPGGPENLAVPQGGGRLGPSQAERLVLARSQEQLRQHSCVRRARTPILNAPSTFFGWRGGRGFVSAEAEVIRIRHHAEPALRLLARATSRGSGQGTGTWASRAGTSWRGHGPWTGTRRSG